MRPVTRKERTAFQNGPKVSVASVNGDDDTYFENSDMAFVSGQQEAMTDEEIKIKALKQATDIAKLMSDVTVDDIIEIAKKVAAYIHAE